MKTYVGSTHTVNFLKPKKLKKLAEVAIKTLNTMSDKYDTLVFCGISGAIIGPMVALAVSKEMVLVRKKGDIRHSGYDVAGYSSPKKYIIIDDFVDSGETATHIQKEMHKFQPKAECLGVLSVQELVGAPTQYKPKRKDLDTRYNIPALSLALQVELKG